MEIVYGCSLKQALYRLDCSASRGIGWMMGETVVDFIVTVACNSWFLWGAPTIKANIFVCLQVCRTLKKMSWYIKSGDGKRKMVPGKSLLFFFSYTFFFPIKTLQLKKKTVNLPNISTFNLCVLPFRRFCFSLLAKRKKAEHKRICPIHHYIFLSSVKNKINCVHRSTSRLEQKMAIFGGLFIIFFFFFFFGSNYES